MAELIEFTEYIAPDGGIYRFESHDKFIISETGWGMPSIEYITQKGPYQHGETVYDYRLQPRTIQLVHRRNACNRMDYWNNRGDILNLIRPNRSVSFDKGVLKKHLPDGSVRAVDVVLEQGPIFVARDNKVWDEWSINETIRFIAHDPTFYDPAIVTVDVTNVSNDHLIFQAAGAGTPDIIFATTAAFRLLSGSTEYALPGLVFSSDVLELVQTVVYTGTWRTYPTSTIEGPIGSPWIINASSGKQIRLNHSVAYGETVVIALPFGNKTITSDIYGNILATLDNISDLAEFALLPEGEVSGGSNVIVLSGTSIATATTVTLEYNTRYIGI
jgi:hypothetical protein